MAQDVTEDDVPADLRCKLMPLTPESDKYDEDEMENVPVETVPGGEVPESIPGGSHDTAHEQPESTEEGQSYNSKSGWFNKMVHLLAVIKCGEEEEQDRLVASFSGHHTAKPMVDSLMASIKRDGPHWGARAKGFCF